MRNLKAFVCLFIVVFGTLSTVVLAEDKIAVIDVQRAMFASNFAQNKIKLLRLHREDNLKFYSCLNASIGFNFAAVLAGIIPAVTPINTQTIKV